MLIAVCSAFIVLTGMAVPEQLEQTQTDGRILTRTFTLAPQEDPEEFLKESFEQDGYLFLRRDVSKETRYETDSKMVSKTVTVESQEKNVENNLALLNGSIEYNQDEYQGILTLLPASVCTEAAGYETRSYTVSDTKTYPDLPYNDPTLIPTSVTKNGVTLVISDVTWKGEGGTGANGSLIPTSYTATVNYSGTGSSRYATGYVTTAEYSGVVSKTTAKDIVYTVTYQGIPDTTGQEEESEQKKISFWLFIGSAGILVVMAGAAAIWFKKRRSATK